MPRETMSAAATTTPPAAITRRRPICARRAARTRSAKSGRGVMAGQLCAASRSSSSMVRLQDLAQGSAGAREARLDGADLDRERARDLVLAQVMKRAEHER